jgi:hypothetical protein
VKRFLSRFQSLVSGVLSGMDRVVFRGSLRRLTYPEGLEGFLAFRNICRKDFGERARQWTELTREASLAAPGEQSVPITYLHSSATKKEDVVAGHLHERGNAIGPICVLNVVEPCKIWNVHHSREHKRILFQRRSGKCGHLYHYFNHPEFGTIHVRLQTWMPYDIQVCVNAREWLARQMARNGIRFSKEDNCFPWIEDVPAAQHIMDGFLQLSWHRLLDNFAKQVHPALPEILGGFKVPYYWVAHQTEWATDVMFREPEELTRLMPFFLRHGLENLRSSDVFNFLGKKLSGNFKGEVLTKFRRRPEGTCIKFVAGVNTLKLYQKALAILRAELTMNKPKFFLVMRPAEGMGGESKKLRPIRRSICDMRHRANVSQAANKRLLDNFAVVAEPASVMDLLDTATKPTTFAGRRVRALQPFSPHDLELLSAIASGDLIQQGFRNRDIVQQLYAEPPADDRERKRRSARVSRLLRLLRGHGIIQKVEHTHRYLLTNRGTALVAAVLAIRHMPLAAIKQAAA